MLLVRKTSNVRVANYKSLLKLPATASQLAVTTRFAICPSCCTVFYVRRCSTCQAQRSEELQRCGLGLQLTTADDQDCVISLQHFSAQQQALTVVSRSRTRSSVQYCTAVCRQEEPAKCWWSDVQSDQCCSSIITEHKRATHQASTMRSNSYTDKPRSQQCPARKLAHAWMHAQTRRLAKSNELQ